MGAGGGGLLITPQDFELYNSVITPKTLYLDFLFRGCVLPFCLFYDFGFVWQFVLRALKAKFVYYHAC